MATSGTTAFHLDVADTIEEAFERCGKELRSGYDVATARRSLNLLFIDWANRGLNLWTVASGSFTTTAGQAQETLIDGMADVLEVYCRRDGTDIPLERISRDVYAAQPSKTTTGRPTQYWLDRQVVPVMNLWPAPENATDVIHYNYVRRIEDAGNMGNTMDMPWRFYPALCAGLAYYLSMKKAKELTPQLFAIHEEQLRLAMEEDEDRASLYIRPFGGDR